MKEIEFLEMIISDQSFGIDIEVVRELSDAIQATPVPNSHPSVEGVYERRGETIAVVNVRNCLGFDSEYPSKGSFVVININNAFIALHSDSVAGIHRVPENKMIKPDKVSDSEYVKGIVKINNKLITVINIEKIISEITGETL